MSCTPLHMQCLGYEGEKKHDLEIAVQRNLSLRKENVSCHTQSLQIHLGSTGCRLSFRVGAHLDA